MNRRSFLRGLLALPLVPALAPFAVRVAQRVEPYFPWMGVHGDWIRTGTWTATWTASSFGGGKSIGTLRKYERADLSYLEHGIKGVTLREGDSMTRSGRRYQNGRRTWAVQAGGTLKKER